MASMLGYLIGFGLGWLGPRAKVQLTLLGLDAAGKTTLLYRLKIGEVVTTIPTIGFMVETITYRNLTINVWDVGGCDKIRPLWRHYNDGIAAFVYVVDANDRDRTDDAYRELKTLVQDVPAGVPILVYANKQDLPNAMPGSEVAAYLRLADELAVGHEWHVQPSSFLNGEGISEGLDWLDGAIVRARARGTAPQQQQQAAAPGASGTSTNSHHGLPALTSEQRRQRRLDWWKAAFKSRQGRGREAELAGVRQADGRSASAAAAFPGGRVTSAAARGGELQGVLHARAKERLAEWLAEEEYPQDTDESFLASLEDCSLQRWDHYSHLRLAWAYLVRHGRREGKRRIFESVQRYIAHAMVAQQKRSTFHETMTYFWMHMVHYALATSEQSPEVRTSFRAFLRANPHLADGGLFLHYYSRERMLQDPQARARVLLPDVSPLPSLVTDVAALRRAKGGQAPNASLAEAAPLQRADAGGDTALLEAFSASGGRLTGWAHDTPQRLAYAAIKRHGFKASLELMEGKCVHQGGMLLGLGCAEVAALVRQVAGQMVDTLPEQQQQPDEEEDEVESVGEVRNGTAEGAPGTGVGANASGLHAARATGQARSVRPDGLQQALFKGSVGEEVDGDDDGVLVQCHAEGVVEPFTGLAKTRLGGAAVGRQLAPAVAEQPAKSADLGLPLPEPASGMAAHYDDEALERVLGSSCLKRLAALPQYRMFAASAGVPVATTA